MLSNRVKSPNQVSLNINGLNKSLVTLEFQPNKTAPENIKFAGSN
jgi:hypothetical protein